MNVLRVLLLIYIIATPILFGGMITLSVRTRNFITNRSWLRRYLLTSLILFILVIFNFFLLFRLFPSVVSKTHIYCVARGEIERDITEPMSQSFVGLIDIGDLDYIDYAGVFEPEVVGYTNDLYYEYSLVHGYIGSVGDDGLVRANQVQEAFLMEDYPCATLDYGERLDDGVYLVYMDTRESSLPYQDQWYEEAHTLYSFQRVDGYDVSEPYDLQEEHVKNELERLLDYLPSDH